MTRAIAQIYFPRMILHGAVAISFLIVNIACKVSAQEATAEFVIQTQPLAAALVKFSEITKVQYIAPTDLLEDIQSTAVNGEYTISEALRQLLFATGLTYSLQTDGTFLITPISRLDKHDTAIRLAEITVTALKRETFLQDVPVAVSTVDGDDMASMGKTNIRDLYLLAPSVSYHGAISSAGQGMRIRGIGSGVIASGVDQSVSTVIDGVVTGPSGSGLQELWDVERIEILRGPQGTLFGKNVSAGAINEVTRNPTKHLEAFGSSRYEFIYETQRYDAMISGPLSKNLLARFAGFYLDQAKGNVDNIVSGGEENLKERYGLRGKLHYVQPKSWSKFSLSYDTVDDSCCSRIFSHIDEDAASDFTKNNAIPALTNSGVVASDDNRISISEGSLYEKSKTLHVVGEFGEKIAPGKTLKSITGYRNWQHKSSNDGDNLPTDVVSFVSDERELKIFSQELQFISEGQGLWDYVLGAYYYHQNFPATEYISGGADMADQRGTTVVDSTVKVRNIALFSHVTYHINRPFAVFAGLRLLREKISATGQQTGGIWFWPAEYPENRVSKSDTDYSGVFGVQYAPSDDTRFYTSLSRGYKGYAIDTSSNSIFYRAPHTLNNGTLLTVQEALLEPETAFIFEAGYKSTLLNDQLLLSVVAFKGEVDDFQAAAYDGNSNSFKLTNAGVVQTQGLELEFQLLPWIGGRFSGSLAWVDTRYKKFLGAPCQVAQRSNDTCSTTTGGQDLSGEKVNENPEWQSFLRFQQDFDLDAGTAFIHLNYAWRDDVIFDMDLDPNTRQKAYGLLDVRLGFTSYENLGIALFVNNATDEDYAVRIIDAPMWPGAFQRYPGEKRTYGVELSYLFE